MKITENDLLNMNEKKIYSIKNSVGMLAQLTDAKYYKCNIYNCYIVITRKGVLDYFGEAQRAQIYGKVNVHYKKFKSAKTASKYINSLT